MKTITTALVLLAAAGAAPAQFVTYYWDINDTGLNMEMVPRGEPVNLKMYAIWEPHDGTVGFAGSIYEILGGSDWGAGQVTMYDNKLDDLTDDGDLRANGDILDIESFQLPPLFNPLFREDYPILLYELEWTPNDTESRLVTVTDANHLNNDFYTDDFGTSVGFDQNPSEGATILFVPAPAGALVLGIGLLASRRPRS